ncbi:MAG: BspA family leucine-rich repeat surface protein, partial [Actinomycetota bacterium]
MPSQTLIRAHADLRRLMILRCTIATAVTLLVTLLIWQAQTARAAHSADFVITVTTHNPGTTDDDQFHLGATGTNYTIDCNDDGTPEATAISGGYTCDYSTLGGPGTYTIAIRDNAGDGTGLASIRFATGGDHRKLITVENWGDIAWTSFRQMFYAAENVTFNTTDTPNTSNVTTMREMFYNAYAANPDTSGWDTGSVTDMFRMFRDARAANPDTSGWDTSSLTQMTEIFLRAYAANPDVSNWDVGNVTDMHAIFYG